MRDVVPAVAFTYTALPHRVIFGDNVLSRVSEELAALDCRKALILSTPGQQGRAQLLANALVDSAAGVFSGAAMHTPVEVTRHALKLLRKTEADCILAIGGGSAIGLGKALAWRTDLPQIVIPTTYAGSEATPILGETEDGDKHTRRSMRVLPEVIIYDVLLTLDLPTVFSVTSGLNAIAHAVEALYARDGNPVIAYWAERGIATIANALPRIVADPSDRQARSDALFGAWACGMCLGAVEMSLHHKLCHVLGGAFSLPHPATHAVVLPHVAAYNATAAPEAMWQVANALRAVDAPAGLFELAQVLGAPSALRDLGLPRSELDRVAELVSAESYWNPRPVEVCAVRALLDDAWYGRRPERIWKP